MHIKKFGLIYYTLEHSHLSFSSTSDVFIEYCTHVTPGFCEREELNTQDLFTVTITVTEPVPAALINT